MDLKKFSVYDQPAESKTVLDSYTQDLQSLNAKITDLLSLNESFEKLRTDLSQYASREDLKLAIVALLEKIDPIQKNLDASLSREVSTLKENIRSLATRTADLDRLVNAEALERNRQLQRSLTEQDNKLHDLLQIVETTSSEQIPNLTAQVQQLAEQVELQNQVDLNPLKEAIDAVKQRTNTAIAGLKVQADDVQHDLDALITEHNTNNELIGVLTHKVDELDSAVGAYDQALTEHREIITEQLNRKLAVIETDVEQLDGDLQAQNNRLADFEFSLRGEVTDVMQGLRKTLTILESSVGAEQASIRDLVQNNSLALKDLIQEHYNKLNKRITEAALTDVPVLTESTVADPGAKTKDPLTPLNQNFVTFDQLKQHYQLFVNRVQQQLVSLGGGGAVRLQDLDDIDFFSFRDSSVNGWPLVYKSATNKWTSSNVMSDATFTGNVAVQGFLSVAGNIVLADATVDLLTVNSDALFEQNVLIQKNLTVEGNITVRGQTSYIQTETLTVDDNIILLNSNVTAAPSENAGIEIERGSANNVLVRWNEGTDRWETTVDGTNYIELANQGLDTNDSPTFVDLNLTGNANILGNVFIGGNLILGNQDTDTVSIGADLISNVIPDASNTYYLGLSTKTWRELHAHHLNINNVLSPQGHTNVLNSINVTGTVSLTSVGTGDVAANVGNINSWLRTTNSNVGNLNSWVSSNSGNIGNLNSWVSSNSSNIGNLNAWASSNSSNIGNLNSWVGNNIDQPVKSISTPTFNGIKVTDTVYPLSDQAYDLGKADLRFKDLWLSGTTIHLGNANLTAAANGSVTVDNNFTTTGNLIVMGNLFAYGNAVQFDTNTLVINDPLIQVGKTPIGDVVDLGFFGHYVGGAPSVERHAGLFRDASDGQFKLFTNLDPEPVNTVDTANASYQSANLVLNHVIGELHDFTAKVRGNVSGGTGVAYNSANGQISIGQPVWTNNSVTFANVTLTDYVNLSTKGLRFPTDAYGGGGDTATITLETAGGEATRMTFTMTNDADDVFNFIAPSNDGLLMNGNKVWHAGNDGAGSGLDADTLDGNNSSFYTLTTNHTEGTNLFFTNTRVQNYLTGSVGNIVPSQNNYYDLGSTAYRWKDLYLSGNTLILGGASLSSTGAALTLPAGSSIAGTQIATTANLNTSNVTEGTNLYFSNARVANAFVGTGTVNALLYLDAGKVATTGSVLKLNGSTFTITTSEAKAQSAIPFLLTTSDASNRFDLIISRTNTYYSIQSVEQDVAYRPLVLQKDGGALGIGTSNPRNKLHVFSGSSGAISSENKYDGMDDNLILYIPFAEGTGTAAYDRSQYGLNGTLTNGPTWGTGIFGYGAVLDNSNDYISVAAPTSNISLGTTMTYSMWIYPTSTTAKRNYLFDLRGDGSSSGTNSYFLYDRSNSTTVTFTAGDSGLEVISPSVTMGTNTWFHVATTRSDNTWRIYLNGIEIKNGTTGTNAITLSNSFRIGSYSSGTSGEYFFGGTLDEAKLWKRTLTANEIRKLYLEGSATNSPYVTTDGNVGIGTSSPGTLHKLAVEGPSRIKRLQQQIYQFYTVSSSAYIHVKTNILLAAGGQVGMWVWRLYGYYYNSAKIIDAYYGLHSDASGTIYSSVVQNRGNFAFGTGMYKSSDNYLVLVGFTDYASYLGFDVDVQHTMHYTYSDLSISATAPYASSTGAF